LNHFQEIPSTAKREKKTEMKLYEVRKMERMWTSV
jgi:hypothetical protein